MSLLLEAQHDDGSRLSDKQLRDEAMTLLLAGHETTAIALSWTWHLLMQHPQAEARLLDELRAVLSGRAPVAADQARLPHTSALVTEAMRLYPPAWVISRQAVEDCEIGGQRVTAGTVLLMSQWVMHRDPRFYDAPEAFRPERWLEGLARELPRFAYFPFGGGARLCIGNSFAMMEAVLLLATIAQRYAFTAVPEHRVVPWPVVTLRPRHGVKVTLRSRPPITLIKGHADIPLTAATHPARPGSDPAGRRARLARPLRRGAGAAGRGAPLTIAGPSGWGAPGLRPPSTSRRRGTICSWASWSTGAGIKVRGDSASPDGGALGRRAGTMVQDFQHARLEWRPGLPGITGPVREVFPAPQGEGARAPVPPCPAWPAHRTGRRRWPPDPHDRPGPGTVRPGQTFLVEIDVDDGAGALTVSAGRVSPGPETPAVLMLRPFPTAETRFVALAALTMDEPPGQWAVTVTAGNGLGLESPPGATALRVGEGDSRCSACPFRPRSSRCSTRRWGRRNG